MANPFCRYLQVYRNSRTVCGLCEDALTSMESKSETVHLGTDVSEGE